MLGTDRAQRYADKRKRRARSAAFSPLQISSVKRWYRLAASTPVSSEYETVEEVLGGTDITQTDADRKPAAATSANGLPVATFDDSDVWVQTLESGNNATASWWVAFRVNPANFTGSQNLYAALTAAGSSVNRLQIFINGTTGTLVVRIHVAATAGREYTTTAALSAGAWSHVYVQFDNGRTDEVDTDGLTDDAKLRIFFGTTASAITPVDMGVGGVPAALLAATGTACIAGGSNSDTPASSLNNGGQLGPNIFFGDTALTLPQLLALVNFEAPT